MKNTNNKLTYFDTLVTSPDLQLAKAVIPYMGNSGKMLGIYIKYIELQNALNYNSIKLCTQNCDECNKNNSDTGIFEILKDFLDEETAETFDMLLSMINMMQENPESGDYSEYMDLFKEMF